jgi:cell division transport system permease protein
VTQTPPRPGPLLPRQDRQDAVLSVIVAILCFLACLAVLVAAASDRAAAGWREAIAASATVQVRARPGQTVSEAAERAAEALAGVKGVSETRALDRQAAETLLEPWLGKGNIPEDLPIPRLVVVDLDPKAPASVKALEAALQQAGVDGAVDDHGLWLKDVRRTAQLALGAALGALALFMATAAAVIAFATRATLQARREVVEVLHFAGAEDRFLAGLVQRRFALSTFQAALVGALLAGGLWAGFKVLGGGDGFSPLLPAAWSDLLAVLPCPLIAAAIAAIAVRSTAMSILRALGKGAET